MSTTFPLDPIVDRSFLDEKYWKSEVVHNDKYGNHMLAKEDIRQGDVIGTDSPMFFVNLDPTCCHECGEELTQSKRFRCKFHGKVCPYSYCSTKCRDWAWDHYHSIQNELALVPIVQMCRKSVTSSGNATDMVAKIAAMYRFPEKNKEEIKVMDKILESIKSTSSEDTDDWTSPLVKMVPGVLASNVGSNIETTRSKEWLNGIFKICLQYSFGNVNVMAILGLTNFINHSCEPNAAINPIKRMVDSVLALKDIKAGEQIFISYLNANVTPRKVRRITLQAQYGFLCECRLCLNDAQPRCDYCGKNGELMTCVQCKMARYCDRQCQKKGWVDHKSYCIKAKKLQEQHDMK